MNTLTLSFAIILFYLVLQPVTLKIDYLSIRFSSCQLTSNKTKTYESNVEERRTPNSRVTIRYCTFDSRRHKLKFDRVYKDFLLTIDGKKYSGTDGDIPDREITSIHINIQDNLYRFPDNEFKALFNPHLRPGSFSLSENTDTLVLDFIGGDGVGGYEVKWVISKSSKKLTRFLSEFPNPEKPRKSYSKLLKVN